jgi:hypothetical protein
MKIIMKSIRKKMWFFVLAGFLVLVACKPKPTEPTSEKYILASENFKIESFAANKPNGTKLDFTKDTMKFAAQFNEEVSWTITITGKSHPTDHAVKVIKGTSKEITATMASWDGASDNIYFFKYNEELDIKVKILGTDTTPTFEDYSIEKPKKFAGRNGTVVVLDFEPDSSQSQAMLSSSSDVNLFFDTDATHNEERDKTKFDNKSIKGIDLPTPVQGNGVVYLHGQDIVGEPNAFFIGGFNGTPNDFKLNPKTPLDSIYFNFYVHSNGSQTTKVVVQMVGIGGDIFKIERNVTWTGWRLVSAKLSDFILGTAGTLGTGKIKADALKSFNIEIHSGDGPGKEAKLVSDFVCFTYGSPFSQAK